MEKEEKAKMEVCYSAGWIGMELVQWKTDGLAWVGLGRNQCHLQIALMDEQKDKRNLGKYFKSA